MSKIHPDAILPDLSKPDSLVKFTKDDITFVYGSKWKQPIFTKRDRSAKTRGSRPQYGAAPRDRVCRDHVNSSDNAHFL
jgi:hypothetical protein